MKKLFTLCLLSFNVSLLYAQTNVPAGDVRGTWIKANSPYILTGNVIIDSVLVIEPGVEVQFPNNTSQVTVNGTLKAQGTSADSIRFIGTGGFGFNTQTGPIKFQSSSTNSVLQYVVIRGLGFYGSNDYTAAIQIYSSSCSIENCYAGYIRGSAFEINDVSPITTILKNNTITDSNYLSVILDLDKLKCLSGNNALKIGITHDNDMLNNDTLTASNQFYRLLNNQAIPQGKTLTINPNVIVQFKNNVSQLSVQGKLNAKGTAGNIINFENVPGEGFGFNTSTGPVIFEATSLTSAMDYVTVTGLGYYGNNDNTAAVQVYSSFCTISNCSFNTIRGSGILIGNINSGKPVVSNCNFSQDIANQYVICDFDKLRLLSGNNPLRVGITHQNEMGQNDTLTSNNLNYKFLTNQTIPQSKTLVIQPGVQVELPNNISQFNINGTLNAQGTLDNPITFTGTGGFGFNTKTGPIIFDTTSINSILKYVTIDGLGYYGNNSTTPAIYVNTSSCSFTNCFIQNTRGLAILIQHSSTAVFNHVCFNKNANGAVRTISAIPQFISCSFTSNTSGIINTTGTADTVTATNCWWGDISGPKQSITNPSGAGDSVSLAVLYSPFAIGPIDCSEEVLPVTLLKFKASYSSVKLISCTWQTTSENNSNYFTIQRSTNAINFSDIGKINAAGNSTAVRSYSFADNTFSDLGANRLYYRLGEVDHDGKKQFSNIATVDIGNNKLFVYPVPANNIIHINLAQLLSQNASISLYNINGKAVIMQKPAANSLNQQLNVAGLAAGNYNLVITDNGKKISSTQIVIMH